MALAQQHRNTIYERLSPVIGEEETEALLLQFPVREQDEPATKELVRTEMESRSDKKFSGAMSWRMERVMALLRSGDLSVTVNPSTTPVSPEAAEHLRALVATGFLGPGALAPDECPRRELDAASP